MLHIERFEYTTCLALRTMVRFSVLGSRRELKLWELQTLGSCCEPKSGISLVGSRRERLYNRFWVKHNEVVVMYLLRTYARTRGKENKGSYFSLLLYCVFLQDPHSQAKTAPVISSTQVPILTLESKTTPPHLHNDGVYLLPNIGQRKTQSDIRLIITISYASYPLESDEDDICSYI